MEISMDGTKEAPTRRARQTKAKPLTRVEFAEKMIVAMMADPLSRVRTMSSIVMNFEKFYEGYLELFEAAVEGDQRDA